MKFSIIAAVTLLATIASASNSFTKPLAGDKVRAGDDLLMKWTADTPGPVDIKLYKGEDGNLKEEDQIVMLETNQGNYTWKVPKDKKPGKDYALQITWGAKPAPEDVNYSGKFEIVSSGDRPENTNSTQTTTSKRPETKTTTSGASPTGTKNKTTTSATESSASPSGTSSGKPTNKASSTPVPAGAPGAFGACSKLAAVVAVAAAVLFH